MTAFHSQLAHVYNRAVLSDRINAYESHMTRRPAQIDRTRFDPAAVLADELMSTSASAICTALTDVDVSSLDAPARTKLASDIHAAVAATIATSLARTGGEVASRHRAIAGIGFR